LMGMNMDLKPSGSLPLRGRDRIRKLRNEL